jgi:hypothetical protein
MYTNQLTLSRLALAKAASSTRRVRNTAGSQAQRRCSDRITARKSADQITRWPSTSSGAAESALKYSGKAPQSVYAATLHSTPVRRCRSALSSLDPGCTRARCHAHTACARFFDPFALPDRSGRTM